MFGNIRSQRRREPRSVFRHLLNRYRRNALRASALPHRLGEVARHQMPAHLAQLRPLRRAALPRIRAAAGEVFSIFTASCPDVRICPRGAPGPEIYTRLG